MAAYHLGQSVKLTTTFTDAAGAAANPTTVTCTVREPDGTETAYTAATSPAVTNPSTGAYQLVITADQSGMYTYRWVGETGGSVAVDEERFHVLRSAIA